MKPKPLRSHIVRNIQIGSVLPSNHCGDMTVLAVDTTTHPHRLFVRFSNTGTERWCEKGDALKGRVHDTSLPRKCAKPVKDRFLVKVTANGVKVFANRYGQQYQVLGREGRKVYIRYTATGHETVIAVSQHTSNGNHSDVMQPSVFAVGVVGTGEYSKSKTLKAYMCWKTMLERKYSEAEKFSITIRTTSVYPDWHHLQSFGLWFDEHYQEGWCLCYLDGQQTASPDQCCFVPKSVSYALRHKQNAAEVRARLIPFWKVNQISTETCRRIMALVF